ncbi:MAG: glycoside hydrolase family 88 protein, partial [Clostridia bacterium]|nr:glycoside hydrolase family 88 protein [Clostridia bacterium]
MQENISNYVLSLIEKSSPESTAWNIETMRAGGKASWNYVDGCMLIALIEMSKILKDDRYLDFVISFVDSFVSEDGEIRTYRPERQTLDDVNEGRVLFPLYEKTKNEKYRLAAERLKKALDTQPRTYEGNFWHKQIYPDQVWLDGVYMAQVF